MSRGRAAARRMLLRRFITGRSVESQEELVALLQEEDFVVTQTTVSRDLTAIGAVKVHTEDGERYRLLGASEERSEALVGLARLLSEFAV